MATKVFGVYLIISCCFLIVLGCGDDDGHGESKGGGKGGGKGVGKGGKEPTGFTITAKQFDAFKGVDPSKNCGNPAALKAECNKLGIAQKYTDGNKPFLKGYPDCVNTNVAVQDDNSSKTVIKTAKVLNCAWNKDYFLIIGKGQQANHYMQYVTNQADQCIPINDIPYPSY